MSIVLNNFQELKEEMKKKGIFQKMKKKIESEKKNLDKKDSFNQGEK